MVKNIYNIKVTTLAIQCSGILYVHIIVQPSPLQTLISSLSPLYYYFKNIYLSLAVLGVCYCTGFSLVAESGAYFIVAVRGLLTEVTSVVEHGLQGCGLQ